jgi:phosphomannomutase
LIQISDISTILEQAKKGIGDYLSEARKTGKIDEKSFHVASNNAFPTLEKWLTDDRIDGISPLLKKGVGDAVMQGRWRELVNAFRQSVRFGTGGIRGMMAFDKKSIIRLQKEGISTDILRGPNTINDLVVLLTSAGVAKFGKSQSDKKYDRIVIGYDSRVRGQDFARKVAELFLAYDYTVYFFDAPCPYPELTFAIPNETVKGHIGVLISASHNDYRYNGYKLSCANGSQFDPQERDRMYNEFIRNVDVSDIRLCSFSDAGKDKLWFLGGDAPVRSFDYAGRKDHIINMHQKHRDHIRSFILMKNLAESQRDQERRLQIAFSPFHGAGKIAVPRLLDELGFLDVLIINGKKTRLNELDGLFPAFNSKPGKEQQPDPGDPRAAAIALKSFEEDYPGRIDKVDIFIGTDPDADRCGIIVQVPEAQKPLYNDSDRFLLPADDMWTLVVWYRLHQEMQEFGRIVDADKKFVVLSHTTSDSITLLARKYGVGVVKSWVGFAALAAVTRDVWNGKADTFSNLVEGRDDEYVDICHPFACQAFDMGNGKRSINIAAMEQSNGFSILGGPPPDESSLGTGGHVRDKDGAFAAVLIAEIAAWGKQHSLSLIELLDKHIYLDPRIGLFMTFYEPDPLDGEYPGIEGDTMKNDILRRALGYYQLGLAGDLTVAGLEVKSARIYRTGKYDQIYPPSYDFQFPDEGIRFYFDEERLNHLTIRPSGTGNSLRFHIQLHANPTPENLFETKRLLRSRGAAIMNNLRKMLKAPRKRH